MQFSALDSYGGIDFEAKLLFLLENGTDAS